MSTPSHPEPGHDAEGRPPHPPQQGPYGNPQHGGYGPGGFPGQAGGPQDQYPGHGTGPGQEGGYGPGYAQHDYGRQSYGHPGYAQQPHDPRNDTTIASLTHLSPVILSLLSAGWLGFLAPLVVWLIYRDRSPFLRASAAAAFNFGLAMLVGIIIGYLTIWLLIGIILLPVVGILYLVFAILAAVRASRGEVYSYPFQIRVLT